MKSKIQLISAIILALVCLFAVSACSPKEESVTAETEIVVDNESDTENKQTEMNQPQSAEDATEIAYFPDSAVGVSISTHYYVVDIETGELLYTKNKYDENGVIINPEYSTRIDGSFDRVLYNNLVVLKTNEGGFIGIDMNGDVVEDIKYNGDEDDVTLPEDIENPLYLENGGIRNDRYIFENEDELYGVKNIDGDIILEAIYTNIAPNLSYTKFSALKTDEFEHSIYDANGNFLFETEAMDEYELYFNNYLVSTHMKYGSIGFQDVNSGKKNSDELIVWGENYISMDYDRIITGKESDTDTYVIYDINENELFINPTAGYTDYMYLTDRGFQISTTKFFGDDTDEMIYIYDIFGENTAVIDDAADILQAGGLTDFVAVSYVDKNGISKIVDYTGNVLAENIEMQYTDCNSFVFRDTQTDLYGLFIDDKIVVPAKYDKREFGIRRVTV